MKATLKLAALTWALLLTAACGQSEKPKDLEIKKIYSLCPKTNDARQNLYRQMRFFANQQKARVVDRSSGAQRELSDIGSDVLNGTGGEPILLTIEKPSEFRISLTNLGLKEKLALAVRMWGEPGKDMPVDKLMRDLSRFWTIQEVDGGVTDDPSC